MKKIAFIVTVLLGSFAALLTALPVAWVAPMIVPSHMAQGARFSGTVWEGQADMPFGKSRAPVSFKISAAAFFTGQSFIEFTAQNAGVNLRGVAGFGKAKDVQIKADIAQLPLLNPLIRGLQGQITADISAAKFNARCKTITGQVRTSFLQANEATWFWRGPELTGPIRCENGNIIIEMTGEEAEQSFKAEFRLNSDGIYTAKIDVTSTDPRAAVVLEFYGFEAKETQFELSETGRWY